MFLLPDDGRLILSPTDLRTAHECEFALIRELDVLLGRVDQRLDAPDPMLDRIKELGDQHEQRVLRELSADHPGRVVQFGRPTFSLAGLSLAHEQTIAALRGEAEVLYQATLFDGGFLGHADFLERTSAGWRVADTKLARSTSVPALLQIAAYAVQLTDAGLPTSPWARLILGSGAAEDIALDDIVPVYRARRAAIEALLSEHRDGPGAAMWGDERWRACGRCVVCEPEVEQARDLSLVAGMRASTRRHLMDAGMSTVEDLVAFEGSLDHVTDDTLARLRAQATLQVAQEASGEVSSEVVSVGDLQALLPTPSPGDLFFDFEGDPLWHEGGDPTWGLEYLFGMVEVDGSRGVEAPTFRAFWAHDRRGEKQALIDFMAHVAARRERWPDLHIYHYAPYERTALLRLAARYGVLEDEVDQLLRDGVLVDLYAVVRAGIRVSQRSYSIKMLEPLYMGTREGEVKAGDQSIVWYHQFRAALLDGDERAAREKLEDIRAYNEVDCVSTLRLRDWLRAQAIQPDSEVTEGASPGSAMPGPAAYTPNDKRIAQMALETSLRSLIDDVRPGERTSEQTALALVASSVLYHVREAKPVWQKHFQRLREPVAQWRSDEGVFVVESAKAEAWQPPVGRALARRRLRLVGRFPHGVPVAEGKGVTSIYADLPPGLSPQPTHLHAEWPSKGEVVEVNEHLSPTGRVLHEVVVEEKLSKGFQPHPALPVGIVSTDVIGAGSVEDALMALAAEVQKSWPRLPRRAGIDLLVKASPRLGSGSGLPAVGVDPDRFITAIEAAVRDLDRSYLAVQGPPGTGKTYVGSHVIARLVAEGWRVGVCAQSHAAIENVLRAVVKAGVDPTAVGKASKDPAPTWTALTHADELPAFVAKQTDGYVIGGTAWDLTNRKRIAEGQLDLLVIDEAGQFSIANTLAVSLAADRLLLLGDPQQLPQVSQGMHPDPVHESALGWIIGDDKVLRSTLGYFLESTWRLHPALTRAVSRLAYAGQLTSVESVTMARSVAGLEAGLHVVEVEHRDRSTWSPEEAAAVVDLVGDLVGRTWTDPEDDDTPRPLGPEDIIVITPYNAQVGTVRAALAAAGHEGVPVGTVDKFQGREAAVAIVSMAASAATEVSRGMTFLLDRNRLNVAISRGKYAAFVVRSDALTDFPPRNPQELIALGAFIGLCDGAVSTTRASAEARVALPSDG